MGSLSTLKAGHPFLDRSSLVPTYMIWQLPYGGAVITFGYILVGVFP